jgi:hypothetical protein
MDVFSSPLLCVLLHPFERDQCCGGTGFIHRPGPTVLAQTGSLFGRFPSPSVQEKQLFSLPFLFKSFFNFLILSMIFQRIFINLIIIVENWLT